MILNYCILTITIVLKETLHTCLGQEWGMRGRWGGLGREEGEHSPEKNNKKMPLQRVGCGLNLIAI